MGGIILIHFDFDGLRHVVVLALVSGYEKSELEDRI